MCTFFDSDAELRYFIERGLAQEHFIYCENNCGTAVLREDESVLLQFGLCEGCRERVLSDFQALMAAHFNEQEIGFLNEAYDGRSLDELPLVW